MLWWSVHVHWSDQSPGFDPSTGHSFMSWTSWSLWVPFNTEYSVVLITSDIFIVGSLKHSFYTTWSLPSLSDILLCFPSVAIYYFSNNVDTHTHTTIASELTITSDCSAAKKIHIYIIQGKDLFRQPAKAAHSYLHVGEIQASLKLDV